MTGRRTYSFYREKPRRAGNDPASFGIDTTRQKKTYSFMPEPPKTFGPPPSHTFQPKPLVPPCDLQYHDTTYSPVLLCQFNDTLVDTSGNGLNLSIDTGSTDYVYMVDGDTCLRGLHFNSLRLTHASNALLQITGDITVEFILVLKATPSTGITPIVTYTGGVSDSSSTVNYLYHTWIDNNFKPGWFSEHGVGVNDEFDGTVAVSGVGVLQHYAVTRISNVITFYSNGVQVGAASSALTTPTDGSASNLYVGGTGGAGSTERLYTEMYMSSLKIVASGLTAAQVKAEYNRTLGGRLGVLP